MMAPAPALTEPPRSPRDKPCSRLQRAHGQGGPAGGCPAAWEPGLSSWTRSLLSAHCQARSPLLDTLSLPGGCRKMDQVPLKARLESSPQNL